MTILVGGDAAFESSKTRRVKTGQQVRTRNTPFILLLLYTHILVIPKLSTREAQLRRFFELRRIEEEIYAGVNEQMNAIDRALGLAPCYIDDEERELIEELDKEAKLLDLEAEMMDAMEFGPENTLSAQLQRMDFEFIQRLMCPQVPSKKKKGVSAPTATRHPKEPVHRVRKKGKGHPLRWKKRISQEPKGEAAVANNKERCTTTHESTHESMTH
ncbi:hypothetical protein O0I10_009561 [Lichtheimia ornata]|uniref:Uncharacterized protein n=1 Tax=Lichtheimia ornata TaxID=688661 RepID=A0AAD7UWR7_9FUNG|nr:uncharacterized protein O0I10_009561 [Lichtheimia ornata]KAJ8654837.1 hypothetical protein O0I10_009561 [Lichtheimia ornata]